MLAVLLVSSGCASPHEPELILQNHPLVDRIVDVQQNKFINRAELIRQILASEYLLLGERHDNSVHHRHQTWVVRQLHQAGHKASVAFEMIDDQQAKLLARHRVASVDQMIGILNLYKTHWNYEQRYKNLFAEVMRAAYPVIPANLNRQRLKQITARGEDSLPKVYRNMLARVPLPEQQVQSLQREIKASHCNMLDDLSASKFVLAQRVRDAVMAHSLTKIHSPVKVLIAGAGHVRKDRGVPLYLGQHDEATRILTIGFTEVEAGANTVTQYAGRWDTDRLPFDIVWFTPQVERHDLCAKFKAAQHKADKNKN